MKRIISFFLTPVLALSLCCSLAFAVEMPPEVGTIESTDANAPRYALYIMPYTVSLQNNTYADISFYMAEKGGTFYFEDVQSISFRTTNPSGSHWKVLKHSYSISPDRFYLDLTLRDMEGDSPSSSYEVDVTYTVLPSMVTGRSLSTEDGSSIVLIPESVRVRYVEETENISCQINDESGIMLTPESVSIRYVGEMENVSS